MRKFHPNKSLYHRATIKWTQDDEDYRPGSWFRRFFAWLFRTRSCYVAASRVMEFEITGYVSPYDPGKFSGPPERCYPPEGGELENWEVRLLGATYYDRHGEDLIQFSDFTPAEISQIEQEFHDRIAEDEDLFVVIQDRVRDELGSDWGKPDWY